VVITGATGQVGTYVSLFLARTGVAETIYLASRGRDALTTVLHNAQINSVMRDCTSRLEPLSLDACNVEDTAEQLAAVKPTLIINCAAALSLYPFFAALKQRQRRMGMIPGFAHTLPKDMVILWPLMTAVRMAVPSAMVVNMAAPDTASAILYRVGLAPTVGAGTIDSTSQGIRVSVARMMSVTVPQVTVRLVTHHSIRRMPARKVSFALRVYVDDQEVTGRFTHEQLCDLIDNATDITGVETMNTPVHNNCSITAASAVETAVAILLDSGKVRHGSGVKGMPGGTPVRLSLEKVETALPEGMDEQEARRINTKGMFFDGVESIRDDGTTVFTDTERYWLEKGLGLKWTEMRLEDAAQMCEELVEAYHNLKKSETEVK
jgi:hypothetical protein